MVAHTGNAGVRGAETSRFLGVHCPKSSQIMSSWPERNSIQREKKKVDGILRFSSFYMSVNTHAHVDTHAGAA